jgi:N-methylhydantoinase A
MSVVVGADIGGTFTDVIIVDPSSRTWSRKVLTTADDYSRGIAEAVAHLCRQADIPAAEISRVVHGTTIATNAILEGKGAKTALITTRGFRDVLELRRLRVPELFSLHYQPPVPLVPRRRRYEADERIDAQGGVIAQLDEGSLENVLANIADDDVDSVAICLLHSYRNPAHETRIGEIVRDRFPHKFVTLSTEVLPEIREYERTSTTVINAYVGPVVHDYLNSLSARLEAGGVSGPLDIMKSDGGIMSAEVAVRIPAQMIESGPAAGVMASARLAALTGHRNLITFDMGGTTAKASVLEDGQPTWTTEYEVGEGITLSSKLTKGRGHALRLPVIDLAEVGAGGGSIVRIDAGGSIKVGPESSGSNPGPACYNIGGTQPTVTDADVVLGYLNPDELAGGNLKIDGSLAIDVIDEKVAKPIGTSIHEAALGVHKIVNAVMIRAIKAVTTYRGRDPRDFAMIAFGGSGPVHAVGIARELGVSTVIVPPASGVFSAIGLVTAQRDSNFVQTAIAPLDSGIDSVADPVIAELKERALIAMDTEGFGEADVDWSYSADLRYLGQAHELSVEMILPVDTDQLATAFFAEHEKAYGYAPTDGRVELVNIRLTAAVREVEQVDPQFDIPEQSDRKSRTVFFGSDTGLIEAPVFNRAALTTSPLEGPMIIEEDDATCVVPPGCTVTLDRHNNVVIEVS